MRDACHEAGHAVLGLAVGLKPLYAQVKRLGRDETARVEWARETDYKYPFRTDLMLSPLPKCSRDAEIIKLISGPVAEERSPSSSCSERLSGWKPSSE